MQGHESLRQGIPQKGRLVAMPADLFLVRHATPDWNRTDLRYDIPPGPPLTDHGRREAQALGRFLAQQGVQRIFASPMERSHDTAAIASGFSQAQVVVSEDLTEWVRGEDEAAVLERMVSLHAQAAALDGQNGPIALVSHGGPIRLLLSRLGVEQAVIDYYRRQFDRDNPVPPAGAWRLSRTENEDGWSASLVFSPAPFEEYSPVPITV